MKRAVLETSLKFQGQTKTPILRNYFHTSRPSHSLTPLLLGSGIAAVAYGSKLAVEAYANSKSRNSAQNAGENGENVGNEGKDGGNWWGIFGSLTSVRYYEGGFEQDMTKREAALILGVRETSPREKVKEQHRRLSMLNHPDTGGSTYVATKINEAKDKLLS